MLAHPLADAGKALGGAEAGEGIKIRAVQIRGRYDALYARGYAVGAVGAFFHILVGQQFSGGPVFAHVHHVL